MNPSGLIPDVDGDGETDDAPAIQAALDSDAPRVVLPFGDYRVATGLKLRSNTHLLVHPHARLRFANGAGKGGDDFLLTNADHARGNRNIRVEGGIWDGNNPGNPRGPDEPGVYTGVMMNFTNVTGLTLRDMILQDAESYFVRLGKVRDFLIEDISFEIRYLRPNQDGIHVSGHCEDGIIRRLFGRGTLTPNDDMAALLADDALHRSQNQNGAFNGPIRRVRIEHLRAHSCHSFIRLLSVDHPIEDVEISDVVGGCRNCAINMDACRDCRVKLFDDADRPGGVGMIRNVRVWDMAVHKTTDDNDQPLLDCRTHLDNFVIERFSRDAARDVSPRTPTLLFQQAGDILLELDGVGSTLEGVEPVVTPSGRANRLERSLGSDQSFALREGGFGRLSLRRNGDR